MKFSRTAWLCLAATSLLACGGDDDADNEYDGPVYIVGSDVSGQEGTKGYVSVLHSLDAQTIDYDKAYEFPGYADVWVWNEKVFVADGEAPIVRRYTVSATDELVQDGELSLAAYGITEGAFWNAIWVSPTKAYYANGQGVYVIWDPTAMKITGTMPYPTGLADRANGLKLRPGSTDRAVVVSGNRLYHPYYWANDTYTTFADDSRIAVYDTTTDQLISVIEAPCTGLDVGTVDSAGNTYFSSWTGAVGLALVAGATTPCAVKIASGATTLDASWTLSWPTITDGRNAAALRTTTAGHGVVSVFHDERTTYDDKTDPFALVGSENWQLWNLDLAARTAAPITGIAYNSGATYMQRIDDKSYTLVPAADYSSTQLYAIDGTSTATPTIKLNGWGIRAFKVHD